MKRILFALSLCLLFNPGFADTLRDFTRNGIFIDTGKIKIPSKKLKYGMEIDYAPRSETIKVGMYDKNKGETIIATVPTSINPACPKKVKKHGCHYVIGSKGSINPVNKRFDCIKLCR